MTAEPDMENLLASIRNAIDSDIGENPLHSTAPGSTLRNVLREANRLPETIQPVEDIEEIQALRSRIKSTRSENAANALMEQPRSGFDRALRHPAPVRLAPPRIAEAFEAPKLRPGFTEGAMPLQIAAAKPAEQREQAVPSGEGASSVSFLTALARRQPQGETHLLSDQSAAAANSAFNQLADTVMARALGERTIEDMTHDLLKGMLKTWLDNNLPGLVERLVREEIERVARRTR